MLAVVQLPPMPPRMDTYLFSTSPPLEELLRLELLLLLLELELLEDELLRLLLDELLLLLLEELELELLDDELLRLLLDDDSSSPTETTGPSAGALLNTLG